MISIWLVQNSHTHVSLFKVTGSRLKVGCHSVGHVGTAGGGTGSSKQVVLARRPPLCAAGTAALAWEGWSPPLQALAGIDTAGKKVLGLKPSVGAGQKEKRWRAPVGRYQKVTLRRLETT